MSSVKLQPQTRMTPNKTIFFRWLLRALLAAPVIYCLLLIGNPNDVDGMYSSYKFSAHHICDVLEFRGGLVILRTCCGDSYYGEYWCGSDGNFVWYYQMIFSKNPPRLWYKEPIKIPVHRHLLYLSVEFDDGKTLILRRRLFKKVPL